MGNSQWLWSDFLENWEKAGEDLASALKKAQKAVTTLGTASARVKRILAGFDQINRLNKKTGSSKKSSNKKEKEELAVLEQQTQSLVTFQEFLDRLDVSVLDLIPVKLGSMGSAVGAVQQLGKVLWNSWQTDMIPVGQWINSTLIPVMRDKLGESFQTAENVILGVRTSVAEAWQGIKSGSSEAVQLLGSAFSGLGPPFDALMTKLTGGNQQITDSTGNMLETLTQASNGYSALLSNVQTGLSTVSAGVVSALESVTTYLQGDFAKNWQTGFAGLKTPTQGVFNGVVGLMNRLLEGMSGTVNGVVGMVNKLKIKIPEWVSGIGGKEYSFSLKTVTTPQIPYLAKGAVLPANQPFLAVVGDQKHGTNVEAPLSTIQEAMAAVMADHTAGNMAGHEATVAVLNRILEAVLGIDVGEAVIARAAQSYRMKESVMKGGGF